MKLKDLNPKIQFDDTILTFDCPKCNKHKVMFPIKGDNRWEKSGETFEDMTIKPSISLPRDKCKAHFFITNGEIILV